MIELERTRSSAKAVLNAGSGPRDPRKLHPLFKLEPWKEITLDIDRSASPDRVGSVINMRDIFENESFDAVWSSHNIEHLHAHEVIPALREFRRVLRPDGFALVTCPDLEAVATLLLEHGLDHKVYDSPAGPIRVLDMIFGHSRSVAAGNAFMAHNTGFTCEHMGRLALEAGFEEAHVARGTAFDLWAILLMPRVDKAGLQALLGMTHLSYLLPTSLLAPV